MSNMLKIVFAVAGSLLVTGKGIEAVRSHRANKTMKAAQLIDRSEDEDAADPTSSIVDDTGALARALERPDGVQLYVRDYVVHAGVQAKALVVIIHGGGWHSAYFKPVADHFNRKGLVVVTYDQRGHGRSGQVDGVRAYCNSAYDHTEDLLAVLQHAQAQHVGLPCYLMSESAGAVPLFSLLTTKREEPAVGAVKGYVMCGPLIRLAPRLLPPKAAMPVLRVLAFAFPKLLVPGAKVEETFPDAFATKETAEECAADPLVVVNPALMRPMFGVIMATKKNYKPATELTLPFLIVHGKNDTRTEVPISEQFYEDSVAQDKTLLKPDAHHQLFQDRPEVAEQAMQDISSWILERVPP